MSVKKNLHEGNILYFGSCLGRAKPRSLIHLSTCFWHPSCQALNLEITKGQGTGKICSLQRGFVISRYFFIYFAITAVKKIVRYTQDFVLSRFKCPLLLIVIRKVTKANINKLYGRQRLISRLTGNR